MSIQAIAAGRQEVPVRYREAQASPAGTGTESNPAVAQADRAQVSEQARALSVGAGQNPPELHLSPRELRELMTPVESPLHPPPAE